MEINEDQPNAKEQRLFTQPLLYKGVSHHHLVLAETHRQAEEWEGFTMGKGEASGVP